MTMIKRWQQPPENQYYRSRYMLVRMHCIWVIFSFSYVNRVFLLRKTIIKILSCQINKCLNGTLFAGYGLAHFSIQYSFINALNGCTQLHDKGSCFSILRKQYRYMWIRCQLNSNNANVCWNCVFSIKYSQHTLNVTIVFIKFWYWFTI